MTKQLSLLNINVDTFDVFFSSFNDIINAANTEFLTANTNANGSVSIGNTYLNGIMFATTLCTTNLRGGNVQIANTLAIVSNLSMGATLNITVGTSTVNTYINSTSLSINGATLLPLQSQINVQTSGTTAQLVDTVVKSTYRGAEYIVTIADNAANNFQMAKAIVFHDSGIDAYLSEYAMFYSNTTMGIFTANANSTVIRLYFTPVQSNTQIKATRTVVAL